VRVTAADEFADEEPIPAPSRKASGKSKSKGKSAASKSPLSRLLTIAVATVVIVGGLGLRIVSRINRIDERNAARRDAGAQTIPVNPHRPVVGGTKPSLPAQYSVAPLGQPVSLDEIELSQQVTILTPLKPRLRLELELPAEWKMIRQDCYGCTEEPRRQLSVVGSGTRRADSTALITAGKLHVERNESHDVTVGSYSARKQVLLSLESSDGRHLPRRAVQYLYDLPEGSFVLKFQSFQELRQRDMAEFEKIAASLVVSSAPQDDTPPAP
jgi:hypothetical protein